MSSGAVVFIGRSELGPRLSAISLLVPAFADRPVSSPKSGFRLDMGTARAAPYSTHCGSRRKRRVATESASKWRDDMCDYSLEMYASRPAREHERYVTTRFPSGSVGFASPGDCTTAVCVQYDTPLVLEEIPERVQTQLGVKPAERVVFARIETGAYHDAVRLSDGRVISLQHLGPGVGATLSGLLENKHGETPAAIKQPESLTV
jgi:hypothetical protein